MLSVAKSNHIKCDLFSSLGDKTFQYNHPVIPNISYKAGIFYTYVQTVLGALLRPNGTAISIIM